MAAPASGARRRAVGLIRCRTVLNANVEMV
jgi:hypothetical protein